MDFYSENCVWSVTQEQLNQGHSNFSGWFSTMRKWPLILSLLGHLQAHQGLYFENDFQKITSEKI